VPPLLLQPLVENAVTHGIAGLLDGGTLRLEARLEGDRLRLRIENPRDPDGRSRRGTGIGLENVRRRLLAIFGRDASMRVEAERDSFAVELELPVPGEEDGAQTPTPPSMESAAPVVKDDSSEAR
jgi:LytS/YehU family sensor histidine kinase